MYSHGCAYYDDWAMRDISSNFRSVEVFARRVAANWLKLIGKIVEFAS
jgi:hypothetical protein